MPIPIAGPLSTNIISDEVGYTMSYPHNLAGPLKSDSSPGTFSLTYFFRNGNVATSGVTQTAPFGMSAFYGQEAIYRCVTFTASGAVIGTATVVSYYKNLQTVTFSSDRKSFCIRQNWDGQMAISNVLAGTYSIGTTCSAITGQSVVSVSGVYTSYGVRVYNIGGYDINGNTAIGSVLAFSASTSLVGGTFTNRWWSNPASNATDGRLNMTGLWNDSNVPVPGTPQTQYVGNGYLSFSINATESRPYYVGIGSDNYMTIKLDGATCISQTGSNVASNNDFNFKYWNIYPITFSAGFRLLELINTNEAGVGSMGFDIYGNNLSSLQNVFSNAIPNSSATPSGLNLIYTSGSFRNSGTFFQNLTSTCPTTPTTTTSTTTTTTTSGATTTSTTTTTTTSGVTTTSTTTTTTTAIADNIVIDNNSTDIVIGTFTLDSVTVPGSYAAAGNSSAHYLATDGTVDLFIDWTVNSTTQKITITDTNGNFVDCRNTGVGDPSPNWTVNSIDMTGGQPLTILLEIGIC